MLKEKGKLADFGGKRKLLETPEDTAWREFAEETNGLGSRADLLRVLAEFKNKSGHVVFICEMKKPLVGQEFQVVDLKKAVPSFYELHMTNQINGRLKVKGLCSFFSKFEAIDMAPKFIF